MTRLLRVSWHVYDEAEEVLYKFYVSFRPTPADKEADTTGPFIVSLAPGLVPYIRHIYTWIILGIGDNILKPDNGGEWEKGFEAIRVGLPNISKFILRVEFVGGLVSSSSKQGLIETVLRLMRIFRVVRSSSDSGEDLAHIQQMEIIDECRS